MSKFYLLRRDSSPDILGVNNGIKQANIQRDGFSDPKKFDYLMDVLGSPNYWSHQNSIHNLEFEIQSAKLVLEAKITDFIIFGPALINCPFLISNRVSAILNRRKIYGYTPFPAVVEKKSVKYDYILPHFARIPNSIIDFSRSIFFTGNTITGKEKHVFNSAKEREAFGTILLHTELIYLNDSFDSELDLFVLSDGEMIISERLYCDLKEEDCLSGAVLLPAFGENIKWPCIEK